MKKGILKLTSFLLAIVMCFIFAMPSFAILSEDYEGRTCPRIFVHGFMAYDLYDNADEYGNEIIYPIPGDKMNGALGNIKESVTNLLTGDYDKLAENASAITDGIFGDLYCDFNGEALNNSGAVFEYPKKEEIKKNSTAIFGYDWRTDPIESAGQLNDFIDYMLKYSGCEQVVIDCHSLGNIVVLTYFKLYGTEKVKSVVFNSSAVYGQTYTGELLSGNMTVTKEAVENFLYYAFDGTENEKLMNNIVETAAKLGILGGVYSFANGLVDKIYDGVKFDLIKLFGNWPTIWAMVPDEMFEEAKEYVFGEIYKDVDCSALIEKIDNYHELVGKNKTEILKEVSKTVNVYVIASYGYSSVPITDAWNTVGDGTIDTRYSSLGGTVAFFGEKLDVSESEFLSPDMSVDASTCLFPEQTWFIKGVKHSNMPDVTDKMTDDLLYYDGQATVDTFEEYPRFMKYDISTGILSADDGIEEEDGFNFVLFTAVAVIILIFVLIILIARCIGRKFKRNRNENNRT